MTSWSPRLIVRFDYSQKSFDDASHTQGRKRPTLDLSQKGRGKKKGGKDHGTQEHKKKSLAKANQPRYSGLNT